jgi:hypothetical protein
MCGDEVVDVLLLELLMLSPLLATPNLLDASKLLNASKILEEIFTASSLLPGLLTALQEWCDQRSTVLCFPAPDESFPAKQLQRDGHL